MSLLVTTFSLILGLYFLRGNIVFSILISVVFFIYILWKFGKRKLILVTVFFGLGVLIPRITLPINQTDTYGGIVVDARDNYIIFQSKLEKYYVKSTENDFEVGDHLVVKGKVKEIEFATFESQFDFKTYLENKGAHDQLIPESIDISRKSLIKIHHFKRVFLSKFDENTSDLISAFLFNDKNYDSEIIKKADRSGILFLFSLSGTYLNILFAIANYLLFLKFSKKTSQLLSFIIFLPLAFFSFTKIGTLRVYGLYILKYLNEFHFKRRKFSHIELVSILALIFIALDYHLVYQDAFYIGFLLSAFAPTLLNSLKCIHKRKRTLLTLIVFSLFFIPIQTNTSYLDLFIIPKRLLIVPVNLLLIITAFLCLAVPLQKFAEILTKCELWILKIFGYVDLRIPIGDWNGAFVFLFIGVLILLIYYLESIKRKHAQIAVVCLLALTTISIAPFQEPISNAVYFVNVGQGDCTIIKNRNKTVMIDTGGYKNFDMAEETLIPFMNKKKINHIDALILTHDDFDHTGAKDSLIENFKVKSLLTEKAQFPYKIGDLYIENLNTYNSTSDNDCSLVLFLSFMKKKFLFMGDTSSEIEKKIIKNYNVDCDILKVGHHGSKYSTCEAFLKAASPHEAIISVGALNYYGHPANEVIDLLNKYDVKIRRTDLEGTISYTSLL